jgi:hypothetical protein
VRSEELWTRTKYHIAVVEVLKGRDSTRWVVGIMILP